MAESVLGIIGGSGLYAMESLEEAQWKEMRTPWGKPSSEVLLGQLHGRKVAFLPRHGPGHSISPSGINYRANIDALKRCGVREIVSVSACGSFREEMEPGDFVVVDQFVDRTRSRASSFFSNGCVAHVSLAHPVCIRLADSLEAAARESGAKVHRGGTYIAIEGPQFSTLAESRFYREVIGCTVIGMTNLPEARLAREAEMCYSTLAMVTDYDCWHPEHGEIDIPKLLATMKNNVELACATVDGLARGLSARSDDDPCDAGCERALEYAILTAPEHRDPALLAKLDAVAGRVLNR